MRTITIMIIKIILRELLVAINAAFSVVIFTREERTIPEIVIVSANIVDVFLKIVVSVVTYITEVVIISFVGVIGVKPVVVFGVVIFIVVGIVAITSYVVGITVVTS